MEPRKRGFLFLKPRYLADSERIAKAIAMCKGVKHVLLTTGEYGFLVSLRPLSTRGISAAKGRIKRIVGKAAVSSVIGHYFYTSKRKTEF
ncbi:MAG: hypothetical protein KGH54_00030 [Candidatus Micrarchaeota archaeon]|nr:hypothetical protein [Candidatus Micrarchaeota archaeon]